MDYTALAKHMSLREKARLLTGADFWHTWTAPKYGLPSIMVSDGPNGLRKEENKKTIKAICFPSATAMAASWDRNVVAKAGSALADECIATRVSVLLGPGINIKRSPLCGRNFEYYSEDPILSGELAASFIDAVQGKGIGTSLKHFAANNTESRRMLSNSWVDDRALREIYLRGFEIAVKKSQPWTIMCAYNKLNGTYCTQNAWLIEDILRGEWGFEGLTVSDWCAVNDRIAALNAGLDLEMPSSGYANVRAIAKAYREGEVSEETVEKSAERVLNLVNKSLPKLMAVRESKMPLDEHHKLAGEIAVNCPVLLKNDGILPLKKGQRIAVIGERARDQLIQGSGSSQINTHKTDSLIDNLLAAGMQVQFSSGYHIDNPDYIDRSLISAAEKVASASDVALVFVSCSVMDACEGGDRESLRIPDSHVALIKAVSAVNPNVAVVLTSGGCVEMPWVDTPRAILQTYLLGEGFGKAVSDILVGNVSPSGKLPETYPLSLDDVPCLEDYKTDKNDNVLYRESIFVGYRYYDKTGTPVLFPFGHGLTYTTFNYSSLSLDKSEMTPDDKLTLSFEIENTGDFNAAEVAQVYVGLKNSYVYRAPKELKDFVKVYLNAKTKQTVTVELDRHAFEYYSTKLASWVVEDGKYDIMIGASSADIRLTATVDIHSQEADGEVDYLKLTPNYYAGDIKNVSNDEFAVLMNMYPEDFVLRKDDDRITADNCLEDTYGTPSGKMVCDLVQMIVEMASKGDPTKYIMLYNAIIGLPLRRFVEQSHGILSKTMVDGLVHLFNSGSVIEMIKTMIFGLPDAVLNIAEPMIRDSIDKKSRG